MSTPPNDGQKPPRIPKWLQYLLIAVAIAAIGTAIGLKLPEHQTEVIVVAITLIVTIIKP